MAQQHHPIPPHRQPTGPLSRQQSLDIRQALSQHLRPRRRPLPGQAGLEGRRVAAGMLQRHRGPAPLGQGTGQPAQLVGVAPQPRQQQHPGPLGPLRLRRRPDLHGQGIAAMGHHQAEALQMGRRAIRLVQRFGPAWRQSHQGQIPQRVALLPQLAPPLGRQLQQAIQPQIQTGFGQGHQQIDQRHLPLLPQQLAQACLQLTRGRLARLRGQKLAQFTQQLAAGPAVQ